MVQSALHRHRRTCAALLVFVTVFPVFPAEAAGAVLCLCTEGHFAVEAACSPGVCCADHDAAAAHDACGSECGGPDHPATEPGCTDIPLPARGASMTAVATPRTAQADVPLAAPMLHFVALSESLDGPRCAAALPAAPLSLAPGANPRTPILRC